MEKKETQQYSKSNSVEIRIILLGDLGVGKKSLINRFKYVNSSETKSIDFNGFFSIQKKQKIIQRRDKSKTLEKSNTLKSKKDTTLQSSDIVEQKNQIKAKKHLQIKIPKKILQNNPRNL